MRAAPAVGPYPGTTLTTPGGNPASLMRAATARAVSGVCSAGFRTIVHPEENRYILFHGLLFEKAVK